jgi:hypothetical protein
MESKRVKEVINKRIMAPILKGNFERLHLRDQVLPNHFSGIKRKKRLRGLYRLTCKEEKQLGQSALSLSLG